MLKFKGRNINANGTFVGIAAAGATAFSVFERFMNLTSINPFDSDPAY